MGTRTIRVLQLIVVMVLGLAVDNARADEASCAALCAMQHAYCDAAGGRLVGLCYYDWNNDICNLNGCQLEN